MKIVDMISYDTELTTPDGTYVRYSHELPSIGLAITQSQNPVLFIVTDHEPIGKIEKSLKFYKDDLACGVSIFDKGLDLDIFLASYMTQGLYAILDEKPVVSEILSYPIIPEKYDFILTALEGATKIDLVRLVVDDVEAFNKQLVEKLKVMLFNDAELNSMANDEISDIEMQVLLGSNDLTFFDICDVYDWIENNSELDLSNFPLNVKSIHHQEITL